jgi:hypothetical protein
MSAALPRLNEADTGRTRGLFATGMEAGLQSIRKSLGLGPPQVSLRLGRDATMIPTRLPARLCEYLLSRLVYVIAALILVFLAPLSIAQNPVLPKTAERVPPSPAANAQAAVTDLKQMPLKPSPAEQARADAAELSDLADQLRDQLHRTDINILSLNIIQKTEAIEKLAKKIKGEADGR